MTFTSEDSWKKEIKSLTARLAEVEEERDTAKKLQLEYLDQAVQRGKQLVQANNTINTLRGLLREACKGRFEHGEWISWVQRAMKEISSE